VGLQGFINFCGNDPRRRKIRLRNLDRIISTFKIDAAGAMKSFCDSCGYSDQIPRNPKTSYLVAELESMKKSYPYCGSPALIIGSDEDTTVPMSIIKDNFQGMKNVIIEEIKGVSHSLGFAKADEIVEKIKKVCG
jgi:pimeloyl-ACP methyl ester carboxylesterase